MYKSASAQHLVTLERDHAGHRREYRVNMWREVKKSGKFCVVLLLVFAASIWPHGASVGGPLHSYMFNQLCHSLLYYMAGRRAPTLIPSAPRNEALAAAILGALAPLVAMLAPFFGHPDLAKGVLISSAGPPCAWLCAALLWGPQLRLCLALSSLSYAVSLLTTPLVMIVVTGTLTIPPIGQTLASILTTVTPYTIGYLHHSITKHRTQCIGKTQYVDYKEYTVAFCGAWLLYSNCCDLLRRAEGSLGVGDLLTAIGVVLTYLLPWVLCAHCACLRIGAGAAALAVVVCKDVDHMSPWS